MVVIVGLGVIGGSYAMGLKAAGIGPVYGVDRDERTLKIALERGWIEKGSTDAAAFLPEADMVILALYPALVRGFLEKYRDDFAPGCLITDAAGVKSALASELPACLRDDVDFVLGHPMAGREKKGIEFASDKVFRGANYILTPIARNKAENLDCVEQLAYALGFSSVKRITPVEHDNLIAYTSQLPHLLAVALVNSDEPDRDTGRFIGDSYRDLTRIASINGDLWSELFLLNKTELLPVIDEFLNQMAALREAIDQNNRDEMLKMFNQSTKRRDAL